MKRYITKTKNEQWWKKTVAYLTVFCIILIICIVNIEEKWKIIDSFGKSYNGLLSVINIIIALAGLATIWIAIWQIKADHERSRREKTLDMIMNWACELSPETHLAVKIVEKFDKDQCKDLYNTKPFKVKKKIYNDIRELYGVNEKKAKRKYKFIKVNNNAKYIMLRGYYLKKLRFSVIKYLNVLEAVLVGWQNGILDKDIVERQYAYLYDRKQDKNCLQDFRNAAGSEKSYPAIEMFLTKLEDERKSQLLKKDRIV